MNDLYAFNDSQFYKLNPTDGNIIWQVKGKFGWYLQPVIYRDYIYIQSRFNVYVLNKNTGNILIQANDMNKTYTRPIIIGDKIFMGMANKYQAIRNPMFGK